MPTRIGAVINHEMLTRQDFRLDPHPVWGRRKSPDELRQGNGSEIQPQLLLYTCIYQVAFAETRSALIGNRYSGLQKDMEDWLPVVSSSLERD
jgi:hypothetical protein